MRTKTILRSTAIPVAAALLTLGWPTAAHAADFPALNAPAVAGHLPGKLVWADLFTVDPAGATKFYTNLLGWTATTIDQKGDSYTVFSNGGVPVAGLSPRSVKGGNHPSRWIGYFAVADIDAALKLVTKDGGTVKAPSRSFPDRGLQALSQDREGIPFGLLQSTSGDPADREPKHGDWDWFEIYTKNPKASGDFYHDVVGYAVDPETHTDRKTEFVLSSAGLARGGIAPAPDSEDGKPDWLGVVRVADLDKTLAKVPGLGGEVLVAPHSVEFGSRFAIILDSTGGTLGLVEYSKGENPAKNP